MAIVPVALLAATLFSALAQGRGGGAAAFPPGPVPRTADANTINWTMTITNPKIFARPWTMTSLVPMGRRPVQIDFDGENTCHEGNVDLVHLKNVYDQARTAAPAAK